MSSRELSEDPANRRVFARMANAPLRACATPGCGQRSTSFRCPEHTKGHQRNTMQIQDERRGSRHVRGYTYAWSVYSKAFLAQHPLCADPYHVHGDLGHFSECVDHIVPPQFGGDFWDASNHQPLCTACNLRKSAEDRRKFEVPQGGGAKSSEQRRSVPACEINATDVTLNRGV